MVLLVRMDLGSMRTAVQQMRELGQRSLVVLDSSVPIIRAGRGGPIDTTTVVWRPTGPSGGKVEMASKNGDLSGLYADLQGIEGVSWRIAVLEPMSKGFADAATAVTPSILVILIGGVVAVFAALIMSRRLVEPLRALEVAAYRAATGSYVKPIDSSRDDEIGQVADAFNAVALRLNALHDLSHLLASASHLDQVLDGILSAMGHIVGPGVAAIYLLDDSGRWLVPAAARGADVEKAQKIDALGESWLARSLRDADSVAHSGDARRLADELPGLADSNSVALVAPLVSGHEALGVVVVLKDKADPITEAEREMVRTFSAQAAIAVHNSRLFAVERESRRVSDGLRSIAEQLVRPDGLDVALRRVEGVVTELFGALSASFSVIDRESLGLRSLAESSEESALAGLAMRMLLREDSLGPTVIEQGEDVGGDSVMERTGAERLLVVPIAIESLHGAVLFVSLPKVAVGQGELRIAEAVSNQMALALENAYLYERALARAANLETIFRISQAVGSSLQVNVVLNRVLDVVQKILSADAVALMIYDPRKREITTSMARGSVSSDIVGLRLAPGEDVPGYVFSTGEPAAFRDLQESMGGIAGNAAAHGLRSMLAVPMLARGRSIGVLVVFSAEPGAFSDEDMNVLQTFASQAALAADTARMYSREHQVASILQASILPGDLPEYAEIDAASAYEPAGADAEIGGDYYDLFRAIDGSIWFAIADVCGKGVVAATKTSMIKYSVRSLVAAGLGPASVLCEVNRMVVGTGEASDIVTLWVGRYDPPTGELRWSSGGHPPAALLRPARGVLEWLAPTGPLLGALAEVDYGEEAVTLLAGDLVLLYTDGVTEARNGNVFFGEDRVRDSVVAGGSPREVIRRLLTAVRRFGRGELRDDVALLAVEFRGVGDNGATSDGGFVV
jgi:serine phosphatase RsbU (regulator of sigma subunit)/HAMP domain-containing protein